VLTGLAYIRGVRRTEIEALVSEREHGGPFRSLSELASRAGAGAPALDLLAWSGTCDALAQTVAGVSPRRLALWQLGAATPGHGVAGGTQLALPLALPDAPALRGLTGWEEMLADYATTGMTVDAHPMGLLRSRLPQDAADSRDLARLAHGSRVRIGGLVVARQRPGTAGGVVFVLLEDEFGVINLIVPPQVYERHRLAVRTEPLLLVEGRLERHPKAGGGINVLVKSLGPIAAPGGLVAQVHEFSDVDADVALDDFRAVAPPVMSFAAGRRR
jgi:error-prone DNA polymerase